MIDNLRPCDVIVKSIASSHLIGVRLMSTDIHKSCYICILFDRIKRLREANILMSRIVRQQCLEITETLGNPDTKPPNETSAMFQPPYLRQASSLNVFDSLKGPYGCKGLDKYCLTKYCIS